MVCYRQGGSLGHTFLKTSRWCEESLFVHWEERKVSIWRLWYSSKMECHLIAQTEILNTSGSTSQGTNSFRLEPITTDQPIPQILTPWLFSVGVPKDRVYENNPETTEFSKTTSEEKSDRFHKKCSIQLWVVLIFELLLSCSSAVPGLNLSLITEKV